MDKSLHTLYRPTELGEVFGHNAIKESLKGVLEDSSNHAFLFTGPSGVGKTTLARIVSMKHHVEGHNLREYDAATYSGADNIRHLIATAMYKGFGSSPNVCLIIDECHALSKQAWQAILKSLEEPPAHVYWCLCTTERQKVPKTIQTRCISYDLKALKYEEIKELIEEVCADQKIVLPEGVTSLISNRADGSPRQALVDLSQVRYLSAEEAEELLSVSAEMGSATYELCQNLADPRFRYTALQPFLTSIRREGSEYIKASVLEYFTTAALRSTDPRKVSHFLSVIRHFNSITYTNANSLAPVIAAIAEIINERTFR